MHVAATSPRYTRREEVDEAAIEREKEIQRDRALQEGKPEKIVDKIVEGRMSKFYEEVVLLEQPFVKDNSKSVQDLITEMVAKLGENITVGRVARFKIGEES
jgi:elongation factor Ts